MSSPNKTIDRRSQPSVGKPSVGEPSLGEPSLGHARSRRPVLHRAPAHRKPRFWEGSPGRGPCALHGRTETGMQMTANVNEEGTDDSPSFPA
jgi:hypothetical protein